MDFVSSAKRIKSTASQRGGVPRVFQLLALIYSNSPFVFLPLVPFYFPHCSSPEIRQTLSVSCSLVSLPWNSVGHPHSFHSPEGSTGIVLKWIPRTLIPHASA